MAFLAERRNGLGVCTKVDEKISDVTVRWADEAQCIEEVNNMAAGAVVQHLTIAQKKDIVEESKNLRRGLYQ
ncbi:unnamed protein product [Phytophthora fragariaefolia]|uniref:Unnamed protein product n=1 Tax=Phytophthora fragariaefolia TaxID=1490495 RepID=A0A9W6XXH0_9STRA|nr:unnamed protein product [Phytophthora fragariaefolia]